MCAQSFSHAQLFETPWTVAHQATLSMEFSRQEYWSGLPCPPPGDLPNPGIEPRSLKLQVDSLLSEPPGKPKNTGMESLSLLQGIFLTQESSWVLLHCRWILYQLSYQGSLQLSTRRIIWGRCFRLLEKHIHSWKGMKSSETDQEWWQFFL